MKLPNYVILTTMAALAPIINAAEVRERINLNREWRYQAGDVPGAANPDFNETGWEWVHLPHSFSTPYFLSEFFYTGYGWYRKKLTVPERWHGKRIKLEFEAVFQVAEIFINGKKAGEHSGGYTGFEFDITDWLAPGENQIAIRVNNLWNPRIAPRSGEHVFSGGIYRDVWLNIVHPLHVAWFGTFITTPELNSKSGKVNIKTEIVNKSGSDRNIKLVTEIHDPSKTTVAKVATAILIGPNQTFTADQTTAAIPDPQLWSPDHPVLYTAVSRIYEDDKLCDTFTGEFAFRRVDWDAAKGFSLNGQPFYLRGANIHQDRAGWGDAATNAAFSRDVQYMKQAGFNIIRGSHYPHDPAFVEACDRQGMMFWSENCFWGTGSFSHHGMASSWINAPAYPEDPADAPAFEASVKQSLREMIRIHRNHPSIIAWSLCNEVFFSRSEQMPRVREFLRELTALAHQLDPSRKVAVGGAQRGGIDHCADIAGYNGDGARIEEYQNPGIPNIVSEYGSVIADRPGEYAPGYTDGICGEKKYPWRSGEILWCGIDHGSTGGRFGRMGAMDYFRLPKRQLYWYREHYAGIPHPKWPKPGVPALLKLNADKEVIEFADGTDDVQLTVSILDADGNELSNSPDVTLKIISGPGEFPTGRTIVFSHDSDIVIRDGKCAIDMRAYYAGTTIIEASSPGLTAARITIESKNAPVYTAGRSHATKEHPYLRFARKNIATIYSGIDMAKEKPTGTSGDAPGHSASMALDGNPKTFWQANQSGAAWFQFTPERIVVPKTLTLRFPEISNWEYIIYSSTDGNHWTKLAESSADGKKFDCREHKFSEAGECVFIRINFLSSRRPAQLSDVKFYVK